MEPIPSGKFSIVCGFLNTYLLPSQVTGQPWYCLVGQGSGVLSLENTAFITIMGTFCFGCVFFITQYPNSLLF